MNYPSFIDKFPLATPPQLRVALTGASGLIGSEVARQFTAVGHTMVPLVRPRSAGQPPSPAILWDPGSNRLDREGLEGFQAVVHLAGENLAATRWTEATRRRILESRTLGTALLCRTLAELQHPPAVLFSASAIGIYASHPPEETVDETTPSGHTFLAEVCRQWEAATAPAAAAGIRVVHLRFGLVLSPTGGVLKRMLPMFRLGLGGPLGSGQQMMSWIAVPEIPAIILHLIARESIQGAVNLVSPTPLSNTAFTRALGQVLHRPAFFRVPAAILRLALGRSMADELLLSSAAVAPRRLMESGYQFQLPNLEQALSVMLPMDRHGKNRLPIHKR